MRRNREAWHGLETLESRQLLAFSLWDGGGGDGDWNNPLNWHNDTLPTAADNVVIDAPGSATIHSSHDVTVASLWTLDPLEISGGNFTVNGQWRQSAALTITGGVISGSGNLVGNGDILWTGGTIQGTGKLSIYPTRTLTINGTVTLGRELINNGSVVWESGDLITTGVGIRNLTDRTFTIRSGGSLTSTGVASHFVNYGTIIRDGSASSTTTIDAVFSNGETSVIIIPPGGGLGPLGGFGPPWYPIVGTVDVRSGTLSFTGEVSQIVGDSMWGASTWMASGPNAKLLLPGAPLRYASGIFVLSGAGSEIPIINAATGISDLRLLGGREFTFPNLGADGSIGQLVIDALGGTMSLPIVGVNSVVVHSGNVIFSAGLVGSSVTIDAGATVTLAGASRFQYANISGAGLLKLTGTMEWTSGDITGPGQFVINSTGRLTMSSTWFFSSSKNLSRRLVNHGTVQWSDIYGEFRLSSEFVNRGTFDILSSNGFLGTVDGVVPGYITNFGTINAYASVTFRNAGGGIRVYNAGSIRAFTGNLIFNGGARGGGNWSVDEGYEIAFGGSGSILEAALFAGAGKIRNAAAATWSNTTMIGTGEFLNTAYGRLDLVGGSGSLARSVISNNGTISLGTNTSISFLAPTTNNGTLDLGQGTLTVDGNLVLSSQSTLRITSGGSLATNRLAVNGLANLNGALAAKFTWNPPNGTVFNFMTSTSRTGNFSSVSATGLDVGLLPQLEFAGTIGRLRIITL